MVVKKEFKEELLKKSYINTDLTKKYNFEEFVDFTFTNYRGESPYPISLCFFIFFNFYSIIFLYFCFSFFFLLLINQLIANDDDINFSSMSL